MDNMDDLIKSYSPLNTKEKIDRIIDKLKEHPGAMNPVMRKGVYTNIQKAKLQTYFNEKYPESMFTASPKKIIIPADNPKIETASQTKTTPAITTNPLPDTNKISLPEESLRSDKKYIYGTYIEMAFHNFFLNMRHIYSLVSGEDIMESAKKKRPDWDGDYANESLVWEPMFEKFRTGEAEERQKVEELLNRHFPILKAAKDSILRSEKEEYKELDSIDILERLSKSIRILRNFYSHVQFEPYPNQVETYNGNEELIKDILVDAFLGAGREVKTRFAYSDKEMKCTEQFKGCDKQKKPIKKNRNEFRYWITEDKTSHLTAFGLIFLCSQFLEKKYSKIFADKARLFTYKTPETEKTIISELIAVYRIRLHQEKLYVSKDTDALAFDILTELRRCPMELFELLRPEKEQKMFRISAKDDENGESTLLVRKQDRFAHLVMKYIDDAKLFENIRFQVSLGKYFYKFYNKKCIDNADAPRVRALSKNVNGFGRLSEIEDKRKEEWNGNIRPFDEVHKNTPDEKPYVTDHHARYVVNGNRIAMYLFEQDSPTHIPNLNEDGVSNLVPTCWLSVYELPAMMMLIHLKDGAFVEEKIKSIIANYKKLFKDIANGVLTPMADLTLLQKTLEENYCGLHLTDIPEDMQNYLTGKPSSKRFDMGISTAKLLDAMIEQTEYKRKRFDEQCSKVKNPKENKFGKKSYVTIQPGKLADFLAKDIMLFQPNDAKNKGKLTGLNFRVMQSVLALYGSKGYDEDRLKRMFIAAHILGNKEDEKTNPIVMRVWERSNRPQKTKDFYEAYLEERLNYLKECKNCDPKTLGFIHADRVRWQEHNEDFYKAKAERYLHEESNGTEYDKALELPRGLFDTAIREELMQMDAMKKDAANTEKKKNISYLIYGYFKKVMCDDAQPMYEMDRTYPLLNKLYRGKPQNLPVFRTAKQIREALMKKSSLYKDLDKQIKSSKTSDDKEMLKRLLKDMKQNETTLKRYKIQDIILFMIAMKLLTQEKTDVNRIKALSNIKLKDILSKDVLSQRINFSVKVSTKNGYPKIITQKDLKLKDYAKFYRFVSDRRMPSLLDLVRTKRRIARELIENELSGYDKVHPNILKNVFDYEEQYYKEHFETAEASFSDIVNNDEEYEYDDKETLRVIRNSFAHCTYPQYYKIGQEAQTTEIPKKATAIAETFEKKIKKKGNKNAKK